MPKKQRCVRRPIKEILTAAYDSGVDNPLIIYDGKKWRLVGPQAEQTDHTSLDGKKYVYPLIWEVADELCISTPNGDAYNMSIQIVPPSDAPWKEMEAL